MVASRCEDAGSAICSANHALYPFVMNALISACVAPNVAWVRNRAASSWVRRERSIAGGAAGGLKTALPLLFTKPPPSSPAGKHPGFGLPVDPPALKSANQTPGPVV